MLRDLNGRVSPTASRVLSALGEPEALAWGQPRSLLFARLRERRLTRLAGELVAYHAAAWTASDQR